MIETSEAGQCRKGARLNMKIGEVAKETGISISNIRFYEKKGLLNPRRQEESGYREYDEEDVRQLKEIMLLRKLGISIESIYLMYQGQAEYVSLLRRQEEALQEQMEMLQGSLELCRFLKEEGPLSELDVDHWLAYVHKEEESGKRFAAAEDFLEDLAEFSRIASFRNDPYVGRFFQKRSVAGALAFVLLLTVLLAAADVFWSGGRIDFWKPAAGFWLIYIVGLGVNFYWFRKRRKKERDEM